MTFCLLGPMPTASEERYARLSQETLYYLRQSYEELAEYFTAKGDINRANEMRKRAAAVPVLEETLRNPPLHSSHVNIDDLPRPKVPIRKREQSEQALHVHERSPAQTEYLQNELKKLQKPDPNNLRESANYLLNRYILGLTTKNLQAISAFFASYTEFPGYDQPLSKEDLTRLYAELLATYQLDTLNAGDFYQLDIAPQLRELDENLMEYILHAQGKPPAALQNSGYWQQFFGNVHIYTFTKQGTDWYLTSLRTLPLE